MGIKYRVNIDFFNTPSSHMFYALGFISADGSLEDASYLRGKYLRICSSDREILEKIKRSMDSEHKIVTIKPKIFFSNGNRYIPKEKYMLRIGSHEIYEDLLRWGITPRKSKTITLPHIPKEFISYFLRGYLDGDGCVNFYRKKPRLSVTFTSGSRVFLEQLSNIINEVVSVKCHNIFENNRAFQLKYSTREAVPLLKYIYSDNNNGLYLERKHNIFLGFLKSYPKWQN